MLTGIGCDENQNSLQPRVVTLRRKQVNVQKVLTLRSARLNGLSATSHLRTKSAARKNMAQRAQ